MSHDRPHPLEELGQSRAVDHRIATALYPSREHR
jgi:hypothetical protein